VIVEKIPVIRDENPVLRITNPPLGVFTACQAIETQRIIRNNVDTSAPTTFYLLPEIISVRLATRELRWVKIVAVMMYGQQSDRIKPAFFPCLGVGLWIKARLVYGPSRTN
jgi:hypothetical protein